MKRSIASKRGTVRGVPPDVYVPFGSYHNDAAPWADAFRLIKDFSIICVLFLVGCLVFATLWAIGLMPHKWMPK